MQAIVVKGETYVPLKALQASGVKSSISAGTVNLNFQTAGGSNQMGGNEGKVGEWLFNGIWRFRVLTVEKADGDRPAWRVRVEIRNGTTSNEIALNNTGYQGIKLVLDTGNQVELDNPTDIRDDLIPQAGGKTVDLMFTAAEGISGKPEKLLVILQPDADAAKYMRNSLKVAYGANGGNLRISLSP